MAEKKKAFSLAEAMRDTIGSASTINMASGGHFIDVNNASDEEITARILQLKIDAGNAILEIGRWLMVMKARKAHGEWAAWLAEQVDFSERIAQQYMQLYQGFSSNPNALSDLGKTKALKLLSLPPKEREEFMAEHNVVDMTSRQLDEAIKRQAELEKERDEAKKAAADFEEDNKELAAKLRQKEARVKELEDAPKEVYRDEDAIKAAADDARAAAEAEWKNKVAAANDMARNAENMAKDVADKLKAAEDKLAKAEEKAKKAAEKTKTAGEDATKKNAAELEAAKKAEADAKAEAEQLRAELEAAKREQAKASIAGDADLAAFQLLFEAAQENVNKMRGLLLKVRGREDSDLGEKLAKALLALADKVKECAA